MKTNIVKETKTKKKINWALPDQSVSHDEFRAGIKEAEKGPFITIDEFEQHFEEWKHKKGL
jgi:predicted transcriptional regulator